MLPADMKKHLDIILLLAFDTMHLWYWKNQGKLPSPTCGL